MAPSPTYRRSTRYIYIHTNDKNTVPWLVLIALIILAFSIKSMAVTAVHELRDNVCSFPVVSFFCSQSTTSTSGERSSIVRADYPRFIDAQTTTFENLLDTSVAGSGLSLEIKKAELAIADLVVLVRTSELPSKAVLADFLVEFVGDAKRTGRDLQRLSSRIWGAVDRITAFNEYALEQIEIAHSPAGWNIDLLQAHSDADSVVINTFKHAMSDLSVSIQELILEARTNTDNLSNLEDRLITLHQIVSREDITLNRARSELLAELWTMLGRHRDRLRYFDEHLFLLTNLAQYRKMALLHVVAALQSLTALDSDLEMIREQVATPGLAGTSIPIEVHVRSIKAGIQRLQKRKIQNKGLESVGE